MMRDCVNGANHYLYARSDRSNALALSPPACTSSPGMLSTPADFPVFSDICCFHFFTTGGMVVIVGFSRDIRDFWVSCGSVVVQL
ncbi:hypothetical protein DPMN_115943 [Dreissena polymorpha]|uniref:Uncharacterized protein n=1 Tax=Dreissena polymorpha TaxID=45954 RepID=A0A9D4KMV2_DREPO|nr:hypothetical protein DPMN_115943 [Dreissena polymorpha]